MADFADRSLGIGYSGGSSLLLLCLAVILGLWYRVEGTIDVNTVSTPTRRGVLLGRDHLLADAWHRARRLARRHRWTGLRRRRAGVRCGACGGRHANFFTSVSRVALFWAAFILTRPLGATVGDFLDKPVSDGGLALSRPLASAVLAVLIILCVLLLPQRAGTRREPKLAER